MNTITLDPDLRAKLNGLNEQLAVRDEMGRTLGYYLPTEVYRKLLSSSLAIPYSEEELARRSRESDRRSLAEIWKELGAV